MREGGNGWEGVVQAMARQEEARHGRGGGQWEFFFAVFLFDSRFKIPAPSAIGRWRMAIKYFLSTVQCLFIMVVHCDGAFVVIVVV